MTKKIFLLVFFVLGLQACATVPGVVEPPKISVQDVALQNLSLQQGTALVQLQVNNPNGFPLPLRGIRYGLNLNGRRVAQGQQVQQRNINPRETMSIAIPVRMNVSEIISLIPSVLGNGAVQYDLQGAVDLPLISVPFSRQGGIGVTR